MIEKLNSVDKWIYYDKDHLMNLDTGMIVSKGTNLKNINQNDIKGYERLGFFRKSPILKNT
jgi:hypothetical protein